LPLTKEIALEHCKKVILDLNVLKLKWIVAVEEETLEGYHHIHVGFKLDEEKPDVDTGSSTPFRIINGPNFNYMGQLEMGLYKSDRPMILYLGKQQVFKEPLSWTDPDYPAFDLKKRYMSYVTARTKILNFTRARNDKFPTVAEKRNRIMHLARNDYFNSKEIIDNALKYEEKLEMEANKVKETWILRMYPRHYKYVRDNGVAPPGYTMQQLLEYWEVNKVVDFVINDANAKPGDIHTWLYGVTNIGKTQNTRDLFEAAHLEIFKYPYSNPPQFQTYGGDGIYNLCYCDEANEGKMFGNASVLKEWLDMRKKQTLEGKYVGVLYRNDILPCMFVSNYSIDTVFANLETTNKDSVKRRFQEVFCFNWRTTEKEPSLGAFGHYDPREFDLVKDTPIRNIHLRDINAEERAAAWMQPSPSQVAPVMEPIDPNNSPPLHRLIRHHAPVVDHSIFEGLESLAGQAIGMAMLPSINALLTLDDAINLPDDIDVPFRNPTGFIPPPEDALDPYDD